MIMIMIIMIMIIIIVALVVIVFIIIVYLETSFPPMLFFFFSHAKLGLDVCPNIKSRHIFLNSPVAHSGCNPSHFHVILHTLLPKSSCPGPHISTSHLHIFARRHRIIIFPILNMSKPSKQHAMPYHLSHTKNTQTAAQLFLTWYWLIEFNLFLHQTLILKRELQLKFR